MASSVINATKLISSDSKFQPNRTAETINNKLGNARRT